MNIASLHFLPRPKPLLLDWEMHPASDAVINWATELLEKRNTIEDELELLGILMYCRRKDYGARLESMIARFIDSHETIDDSGWSALAGACMAADVAGYLISATLLWRIVYQYPDFPVGGFVEDIAKREGQASYAALVECFERHPSDAVRASIFRYFESEAPRTGMRVIEKDGKLLLEYLE